MNTLDVRRKVNEFTATVTFRVHILGEPEPREFTQRVLTAGLQAHTRRVEKLYREVHSDELRAQHLKDIAAAEAASTELPDEPGISALDLSYFIMADRALLNHYVGEVYQGNHDGIDWYEQDGSSVLTLLLSFMMRWFGTSAKSTSASLKSSPTSDTSSNTTSAAASLPKNSTNGSTKKPRGKSPRAARTTTTS